MSVHNLDSLLEEIEQYAAASRPFLHSLLVLHHDTVLLERYWRAFAATSYQPVFSVTKSVVSALAGLALIDGKLTLADTLAHWFPEVPLSAHAASVTVHHLLTMTAGFAPSSGKPDPNDVINALLKRPAVAVPGEKFHYDNNDPNLLVAVIERAVGIPALDYAYQRLFTPLGIWRDVPKSNRKRLWMTDRQGQAKGGYGLHLTTRELAALGQLYLHNGRWESEQLIPADYVTASTTLQAAGGYPEFVKYGYYWWVLTDSSGHPAFFASGRGGQYIYVVPALDLVVVVTCGDQNADGRPHRVMAARMVTKFVAAMR
ncbi:MAG: serine hydrolase [Anaerolineae bacterium]